MLAASVAVWAQNDPTTKPSDSGIDHQDPRGAARSASGRWGVAPYNRLSTVTDEQKRKIEDIHRKALDDIREIREKEEADIMALLSDEQKTELEQMEADRKAEAAKRRAERKQQQKEENDK